MKNTDINDFDSNTESLRLVEKNVAGLNVDLMVSEKIGASDLKKLFDSLSIDECSHSWKYIKNHDDLSKIYEWENKIRETNILFFYFKKDNDISLVGTGSIGYGVNPKFRDPSFIVLGRCFILPKFRGKGLYRKLLHYRLKYSELKKNQLDAIHVGTNDSRVEYLLEELGSTDEYTLLHLGFEYLNLAATDAVKTFVLIKKSYKEKIFEDISHNQDSAGMRELFTLFKNQLSQNSAVNIGATLSQIANEYELNHWNLPTSAKNINKVIEFCKSLPTTNFK